MNPRHRDTARLTLGFLTLGAQAAPQDVIDAAAAAGYGAAGLRVSGRNPGDPWPSVDGDKQAFAKLRARAADKQVRISSISGYYLSAHSGMEQMLANVHAARETGAPLICQGCFDPSLERVADFMRGYAAAAAEAGVRIALEFMPMSTLKTLEQTLALIARSGASNIGLLVDSLHLARSGAGAREIAALDPARIFLTQLCDAPAELAPGHTLFDEAMSGRMYLGDGALDLAGLVRALPPEAEIELETPVVADAALAPAQRALRAADKARTFFGRHFAAAS
jgi:sugar phosphate isomerase/epimerase